jgi:hypothetical protein
MTYVYTLHVFKRYGGEVSATIWIRPEHLGRTGEEPLRLLPIRGRPFPCDADLDHARNVLAMGTRAACIHYYEADHAVAAMREIALAVASADADDPLPIYLTEAVAG